MPFNSIFAWIIKKRIHQIDLFKKYPFDVQQETFEKLIYIAKDTEWGKENHYSNIKIMIRLNEIFYQLFYLDSSLIQFYDIFF